MHRREEKELKRKEKVLAELDGLFQEWVRSCGRDVNIEDVNGKPVRGRLETSGTSEKCNSYKPAQQTSYHTLGFIETLSGAAQDAPHYVCQALLLCTLPN
jgi:hypothetical protein